MAKTTFKASLLVAALAAAACMPGFAQPSGLGAHAAPTNPVLPTAGNMPVVSGVEAKPGNIMSIMVPTTTLVSDPQLAVHVNGMGKTCQYHLVVINTDSNKEYYFPQTSKLPTLVHANLPLNQFAHGNYKVAAMAWGADNASGMACTGGGGAYTPFKIERPKITAPADSPKIIDVALKPGKSTAANTYRPDESLAYSVVGSVDNVAPQNAEKRCGWTTLLEGNGQSVQLGNGTFFNMPMTASLAAFKPGTYTLTAKTTAGDDSLAKQPCLGHASKTVTIVPVPGQIKGLKLEARGIHGDGKAFAQAIDNGVIDFLSPFTSLVNAFVPDNGVLKITPIIEGPKCFYRVTQIVNGGQLPFMGPRTHTPSASDRMPAQIYSADSTIVQVTVEAGDLEKTLGACEGSITKTITVYDNPKLPPVAM